MDTDIMKLWEQNHLDDYALKNAQESLSIASKQNEELAQESRQLYDIFYDKILLYSAGAFSFSVALVGLVVSDKIYALSKIGFILPNIYWLYGSLIGYLFICGAVLMARRFDAAYVASFGMYIFCDKKKKEQEALLTKLSNYPGEVLVTNDGTRESEIQTCKQNIILLEKGIMTNARQRDRNFRNKRICHIMAEILVIFSTGLLLLFTIQLIQAIIWG